MKRNTTRNATREAARIAANNLFGNRCACCGSGDDREFNIDHIVPLRGTDRTRGEEDPRTIRNRVIADPSLVGTSYQLLCGHCNRNKGAKKTACDCAHGQLNRDPGLAGEAYRVHIATANAAFDAIRLIDAANLTK